MNTTHLRRTFPAAFLAAFVALAPAYATGCRSSSRAVASPYSAPALEIQTQEITLSGEKLQFKMIFVNRTPNVMKVDRNQLKLVAGGQTLTRFAGKFGNMTSPVHVIAPAMSHAVYVDYIVGDGFSGPATLALSQGGVIVNDAPLPLPDFTVTVPPAE